MRVCPSPYGSDLYQSVCACPFSGAEAGRQTAALLKAEYAETRRSGSGAVLLPGGAVTSDAPLFSLEAESIVTLSRSYSAGSQAQR